MRDVEQTGLVDGDHPLPLLDVGAHDGAEERQAGVVDQDVEPAEAVDGGLHGAVGLGAVGDFGFDCQSGAARCFDLRDKRVEAVRGALYRRRNVMIEPVFGNTKFNRRIGRFQRRGRAAARSEWLITATHNLLKLHTHTLAAAGA